MKKNLFGKFLFATLSLSVLFIACKKDDVEDADILEARAGRASLSIPDITFYALYSNKLDQYSASAPETVVRSISISGLGNNENILVIDFRPATGQLFGIASTGQLYRIDLNSGAASKVGTTPVTLNGTIAAFDFNPTVDRIRLVSSSGQNFRLHPETGAVAAVDGSINGQAGAMIAAVAYTNNVGTATTATLFDIDLSSDQLFKQIPPNDGTLMLVGPLGFSLSGEGGFDIAPSNDYSLALFEENSKPTLFTINLTTGKATIIAKYKRDKIYTGIAIATN